MHQGLLCPQGAAARPKGCTEAGQQGRTQIETPEHISCLGIQGSHSAIKQADKEGLLSFI